MQDTLYIDAGDRGDNPALLRTHTSPGQIMQCVRPVRRTLRIRRPFVSCCRGCVSAASRSQLARKCNSTGRGLAVGEKITFADLKGTLSDFARRMFGQKVRYAFPRFLLPFTEPSAEMDVECFVCGGAGCQVCKQSGWLEILGCAWCTRSYWRTAATIHAVIPATRSHGPERS